MSLEAKDLLINVLQYINNPFQGFEVCLKEYKNDAEKLQFFIHHCKECVEKKWNEENGIDTTEDSVGFFDSVLKPLLFKTSLSGKKLSSKEKEIIKYFTRLALFKNLFESREKIPFTPVHWFITIKKQLDEEFLDKQKINIKYEGKTINSLEELDEGIKKNTEIYQKYNNSITSRFGIKQGVGLCLVLNFLLTYSSFESDELRQAVAIISIIGILYGMYNKCQYVSSKYAQSRVNFFKDAKYKIEKTTEAISDKSVQKFFFVTHEKIESLKKENENNNEGQEIRKRQFAPV